MGDTWGRGLSGSSGSDFFGPKLGRLLTGRNILVVVVRGPQGFWYSLGRWDLKIIGVFSNYGGM